MLYFCEFWLIWYKQKEKRKHKSLLSVDATAAAAAEVNSTLHAALLFMMCQKSCRAPSLLFFCCAAVCAKLLRIRELLMHNIVVSCVLEASTFPPSAYMRVCREKVQTLCNSAGAEFVLSGAKLRRRTFLNSIQMHRYFFFPLSPGVPR